MKTRDERIEWHQAYCAHYDGRSLIQPPYACRAGVKYETVGKIIAVLAGNEKRDDARPCVKGHLMPDALTRCPKWQRVTVEAAEAAVADMEGAMARMAIIGPVVSKWRTWTKLNRVSKVEVIECPACKGRLHLSQSSYNGHVHGQCETEGCASWME